jgi:hypothetical protein
MDIVEKRRMEMKDVGKTRARSSTTGARVVSRHTSKGFYKLVQLEKDVKHHKCESNLDFGQKLLSATLSRSKTAKKML